ncbi:hypothetical protein [Telmatospirillum sp.]|uniref:hypothetical protein n=1 Tax=Telmatospirillum sp. TaxID=2079197 RepID=UPI002850B6CF|nr:hypothetical protein [Telmatospirillum sp.]MDR3436450.1 hypothetical protein [Telmatospirillum sp.]
MTTTLKAAVLKDIPYTATALYTNNTGNTSVLKNLILNQKNNASYRTTAVAGGASGKTFANGLQDYTGAPLDKVKTVRLTATRTLVYGLAEVEYGTITTTAVANGFVQVVDYDDVNDRYSTGPATYIEQFHTGTTLASFEANCAVALSASTFAIVTQYGILSFTITDVFCNLVGSIALTTTGLPVHAAPVLGNASKLLVIQRTATPAVVLQAYNLSGTSLITPAGTAQTLLTTIGTIATAAGCGKVRVIQSQPNSAAYTVICDTATAAGRFYYAAFTWTDATNTATLNYAQGTYNETTASTSMYAWDAYSLSAGTDFHFALAVSGLSSSTYCPLATSHSLSGATASHATAGGNVTSTSAYFLTTVWVNTIAATLAVISGTPSNTSYLSGLFTVPKTTDAPTALYPFGGVNLTTSTKLLAANTSVIVPFDTRLAVIPNSSYSNALGLAVLPFNGTRGDIALLNGTLPNAVRPKYVPFGHPSNKTSRWNATYNCWCVAAGAQVFYLDVNFNQIGFESISVTGYTITCLDVFPNGDLAIGINRVITTSGWYDSYYLANIYGYVLDYTPSKNGGGEAITPNWSATTTVLFVNGATSYPVLDLCVLSAGSVAIIGFTNSASAGYAQTATLSAAYALASTIQVAANSYYFGSGYSTSGVINPYDSAVVRVSNTSYAFMSGFQGATWYGGIVKGNACTYIGPQGVSSVALTNAEDPDLNTLAVDRNGQWGVLGHGAFGLYAWGPNNNQYVDWTPNVYSALTSGVRCELSASISNVGTIAYAAATTANATVGTIAQHYYKTVDVNTQTVGATGTSTVQGAGDGLAAPWVEDLVTGVFNITSPTLSEVVNMLGNQPASVTVQVTNNGSTLTPYSSIPVALGATAENATLIFVPPNETVYLTSSVPCQIDAYGNVMEH